MTALPLHRFAAPSVFLPSALCAAALLACAGAQAQSNACEMLKATLAARIAPDIKGYSLEAVPARTPVPSGGRVIGNCDGGAFKIVYRRFGGAPLVAGASDDAASAPGATTAAPAAPAAPPAAATVPPPAPSPKPAPPPALPAAKPAPVPSPPAPASAPAPKAPAPAVKPAPLVPMLPQATARIVEPARIDAPAAPEPAPPPSPGVETPAPEAASDGDATPTPWRWLWTLLALPLVGWLWAWLQHRRRYDSAGLPRGPRLN